MAKAQKKKTAEPDRTQTSASTPTDRAPRSGREQTAKREPRVTHVSEFATFSVRLTLSDGSKLDLIAAGGGSFDANKEIRTRAIEALTNTL